MQYPIYNYKKSKQNSTEAEEEEDVATPIASQILHLFDKDIVSDLFRQPDQFTPSAFTWSDDELFSSSAAEVARETGASIDTQFPCYTALDVATLLGAPPVVLQPEPDVDLLQAARWYSPSYSSLKPDPLTMFPVMHPSNDKFSSGDTAERAFQQCWPTPALDPVGVGSCLRRHQQWGAGSQWEMKNRLQERSGLAGMEADAEGTGGGRPRGLFDTGGRMAAVSEAAFHGTGGRFPRTVPASSVIDNYYYNVLPLSAKERNEKIQRYMQKRSRRNWSRSIKYACRKTIADTRARDHGRFIRNHGFGETRRSSPSNDKSEHGEFGGDLRKEDVPERGGRRRCSRVRTF